MKSAIEQEIIGLLVRFRYWLRSHDRGVILGLIFSIPPIPPVPLIGLSLSLFNYVLWKKGKLGSHEITLIRTSLLISLISFCLAFALVYLVISFVSNPETSNLVADFFSHQYERVRSLFMFFLSRKNTEVYL